MIHEHYNKLEMAKVNNKDVGTIITSSSPELDGPVGLYHCIILHVYCLVQGKGKF